MLNAPRSKNAVKLHRKEFQIFFSFTSYSQYQTLNAFKI